MIVSASRRTDIPALYADWLVRRLEAGFCTVPNPYNANQVRRVSLVPGDVDAVVFWTRHAQPLFPHLPEVDRRGIPCVFQYTITGYGRRLEARTPPLDTATRTFRDLAARRPAGSVVWRYDPILVGPGLPPEEHVARFGRIASALEGVALTVVVSFADPYRKTRRRVGESYRWGDDLIADPATWPGRHALLSDLASIAGEHGMAIEACAEEEDYSHLGVPPTKCIDDRLLARLFGGDWPKRKDPGQRPACRCVRSVDIGIPDTCTFGCAYCYATRSDDVARRRHAEHDPSSPSMWGCFEA